MSKDAYASGRLEHAKAIITHYFEELAEANGQSIDVDEIADALEALFDAAVAQAAHDLEEELERRDAIKQLWSGS